MFFSTKYYGTTENALTTCGKKKSNLDDVEGVDTDKEVEDKEENTVGKAEKKVASQPRWGISGTTQ